MTKQQSLIPAILMMGGFLGGTSLHAQQDYSLDFNTQNYKTEQITVDGNTVKVRAFERIIYVRHPVDTTYEQMNIFVPEAYFNGGSINGYTAETAPVFFPNQVGGYMPGRPGTLVGSGMAGGGASGGDRPHGSRGGFNGGNAGGSGMPPGGNRPEGGAGGRGHFNGPQAAGASGTSTIARALAQGYVVASPGARGRTGQDDNGTYTGKAPAAIVDLKAAVRYLKYNDSLIPGDANKIISNGTSAGGALSALLGATGDNADYLPYLESLGAAEAGDVIFAASAYCPITNLDHADMAYEWQFNGINTYRQGRTPGSQAGDSAPARLTEQQIKVSTDLSARFPDYLNSLHLKDRNGKELTLDASGNGSFKDYIKSCVIASAQMALDTGHNLSALTWLTMDNGKVKDLDYAAYIRYMERQKTPPAFDALDLSSPENSEFGTETTDKQHFTDYSQQYSTVDATKADALLVKLMNPMYYIGQTGTTTATHWRIRHGTKDKDTGLAISAMLAMALENNGYAVDYALPWDRPHSGDYDLPELFQWIDGIAR